MLHCSIFCIYVLYRIVLDNLVEWGLKLKCCCVKLWGGHSNVGAASPRLLEARSLHFGVGYGRCCCEGLCSYVSMFLIHVSYIVSMFLIYVSLCFLYMCLMQSLCFLYMFLIYVSLCFLYMFLEQKLLRSAPLAYITQALAPWELQWPPVSRLVRDAGLNWKSGCKVPHMSF